MKRRGQQPPSLSGQQLPSSSGLTAVEKPGTTISLPRTVHLSVQNCAHGGAPNLASRASAQQKSVKFWKRFLQGRAPLALGCARRWRYPFRCWWWACGGSAAMSLCLGSWEPLMLGQAEMDAENYLVSSLSLISVFLPSLNKLSNVNVNINVTQLAALESTLTLSEPVGLTVSKRVSWQLKKPQKLAKANASLG